MAAQSLSKPPYETQVSDKNGVMQFSWTQWFQSLFRSIIQLDSGLNQGRQL